LKTKKRTYVDLLKDPLINEIPEKGLTIFLYFCTFTIVKNEVVL
jgi:hypothetical protein